MTTKVTVDAHAGWPVKVIVRDAVMVQAADKTWSVGPDVAKHDIIVAPGERRDFYATNTRSFEISEEARES